MGRLGCVCHVGSAQAGSPWPHIYPLPFHIGAKPWPLHFRSAPLWSNRSSSPAWQAMRSLSSAWLSVSPGGIRPSYVVRVISAGIHCVRQVGTSSLRRSTVVAPELASDRTGAPPQTYRRVPSHYTTSGPFYSPYNNFVKFDHICMKRYQHQQH